ncbi:hypothetical protein Adu01nite_94350 [Paractinoplanes durhamensis]|uniref:DUF4148 domain-containing protein n=1 Tax=Paractinoplanes durhamensis TaxID=113563 RepID=A0ABQ3ZE84_9ACTN|nr:hypothetical protein Adu01nite_94350 [Actinoplanes durhamensis]
MKPRYLAAGVVIMLWATMTGSPAAADKPDGDDGSGSEPPPVTVLQFGGPSMTWEQATSQGERQLSEAEWREAIKQTGRDSSTRHYYPELPDDPSVEPSPKVEISDEQSRGR